MPDPLTSTIDIAPAPLPTNAPPRPSPEVSSVAPPLASGDDPHALAGRSATAIGPSRRSRVAALGVVAAVIVTVGLAGRLTVQSDVERGFFASACLLVVLMTASAWVAWRRGSVGRSAWANGWLALALVPLVQITAVAAPLNAVGPVLRYALIAVPLLAATMTGIRASGFSRRDLGLILPWSWLGAPLTIIAASGGVAFGYLMDDALAPSQFAAWPLASPRTGGLVAVLVVAAVAEEVLFRGLIQRAMRELLGPVVGVLAAAGLYASLAAGRLPPLEVAAIFAIAALYGALVVWSRSLLGAIAAHAAASICVLLVLPRYL